MKNRLFILSVLVFSLLIANVFSQPITDAKKNIENAKQMLNKAEALKILAEIKIRQSEYYLGSSLNLLPKINQILNRINLRLRKEPKNAPFLMARSYAYYAIADYLDSKTPFGKNKLNDTKIKNNLNLASKEIEKAIILDKSMGDYFSIRGEVRITQCKFNVFNDDENCFDKPLKDFNFAIYSMPNDYTLYNNRIDLYKAHNKIELAQADEKFREEFKDLFNEISLLQERLETQKTEESYYRLGKTLMMTYDKLLEYNEKYPIQDQYAILNHNENQLDIAIQAKESYDQALELSKDKEYLFNSRGFAYLYIGGVFFDIGDKPSANKYFELSVQDFTEAIKLNPTIPQHYTGRATAYKFLEKEDLRKADLEKAKSLEKTIQ